MRNSNSPPSYQGGQPPAPGGPPPGGPNEWGRQRAQSMQSQNMPGMFREMAQRVAAGPMGQRAQANQMARSQPMPWDQVPRTQWGQQAQMPPQAQGAPPQMPPGNAGWASMQMPAQPSAQPPISPEGYGQYRKLAAMPVTGGNTRKQYNKAATQFAQQHGTGFDPKGVLAKTKALRKQYRSK